MLKKLEKPFTCIIEIAACGNGFAVIPAALLDNDTYSSVDQMLFTSSDYYESTSASLPKFIEKLFQGSAEVPESWIKLQNSLDNPADLI